MTLVHIVQKLAPGGIESLALTHAAHGGGRTLVFSLEGETAALAAAWPAVAPLQAVVAGFGKRPGLDAGLPLRLAAALRAAKATGVVTHHVGPMLHGGLAARLAGIKALLHVEHDAWHLAEAKRRRLVSAAARILRPRMAAVSSSVAAAASARLGLPVAVAGNGVDTARFRPADRRQARIAAGLPVEGRLVGGAGRLETVKGFDQLIEAATALPADIRVVLVGEGSQRLALETRAAALGLGERVLFAGRRDRMEEIYPALDLFCLPSRAEGLPLALLEAQACGVPAAAFDVGGVAEAMSPDAGALVEAGSSERLAAAIVRTLSAAAPSPRAFVEERFSLAAMFDAYERLLRTPAHA